MDKQTFDRLKAEGFNRVPVYREVLADLDTPLSVYLKLADGPDAYLLESVEGSETWGRFSIIGLPCRRRFVLSGSEWTQTDNNEVTSREVVGDPLARIAALQAEFRAPRLQALPLFTGGLVGYFAYETVQRFEPHLALDGKTDELGTPEVVLLLSEEVAVFDNLAGRLYLIVNADPNAPQAWDRAQRRLDQLSHRLRIGGPGYGEPVSLGRIDEADFHYGFSREDFI
jgi:anthranilate synthase component 1